MLRYFGVLPAGRRAGERNRINCRGCCDALRQSLYFDCLRNVLRRRAGRKGLVFPFRLSVSFFYALRKAVFALRINGGSPFGLAVMQLCREHIGDGCRLSVRGCVAEA